MKFCFRCRIKCITPGFIMIPLECFNISKNTWRITTMTIDARNIAFVYLSDYFHPMPTQCVLRSPPKPLLHHNCSCDDKFNRFHTRWLYRTRWWGLRKYSFIRTVNFLLQCFLFPFQSMNLLAVHSTTLLVYMRTIQLSSGQKPMSWWFWVSHL